MQLGSSLHAFGAAASFLVIVWIWVRVAAKLYDPHGSTKKSLYQLAFALDGSGIGTPLSHPPALFPACHMRPVHA